MASECWWEVEYRLRKGESISCSVGSYDYFVAKQICYQWIADCVNVREEEFDWNRLVIDREKIF